MTPIRHEGDFRRKPIKDWDSYIEDAITEAQERGEFDDLPDAGKPIKIQTNPHAPELDFAYSRLKNAGYKPPWMELDEEIKSGQHQLQSFLDDSVSYITNHAAHIRSNVPDSRDQEQPPETKKAPITRPHFWKRLLYGVPSHPESDVSGPKSLADLRDIVARMRTQYLQRSTELDKRIGEFNMSLSRDLWHLERMRLTPERAARKFDDMFGTVDLSGQ